MKASTSQHDALRSASTQPIRCQRPVPVSSAKPIALAPVTDVERVERMEHAAEPEVRPDSTVVEPRKASRPTYGNWILVAVVGVVVLAVTVLAKRASRRRPELRSR